jgi:TolB protein
MSRMNNSKMMRATSIKLFVCFVSIFLILCQSQSALGKVYIDIDSPVFQKFPIAITDFKKLSDAGNKENMSAWFSDKLSYSLVITGFFNVINKKAFLEDQKQTGLKDEGIRFADWNAIGAEYLVKGSFLYNGRDLITEFYLFDVIKGETITAKRYAGKIEDRDEMVRKFAGDILSVLTGDEGVFGTKLAFVLKKGLSSDIYTINFDGTGLVRVTDNQALTLSPRWSPDGKYISFTSYKDGNPDLYIKALHGSAAKKIAGFEGINLAGSWSRNGKNLLLTLSKDGSENLYMMDINSRNLTRLTNNFAIDVSPAWSPDNQKIAFVSNRSGSPQIYIMEADGKNVKRLTYDGNYNTSPSWSPKGNRIAYEGLVNGRFQICSIDEDGSNKSQLTFDNGDHESPSWSPDGRYLVFSSRGNGKNKICIMNANGQNIRILYESANGCISPSWSPRLQ